MQSNTIYSPHQDLNTFLKQLSNEPVAFVENKIIEHAVNIDQVLAGFAKLAECEQGIDHHAEGNALIHTAKVFATMMELTESLPDSERKVLLIAALVHDIEKPATREQLGNKITFLGHAELAADRSHEFGLACNLTKEEVDQLDFMVRHHMNAHQMVGYGDKARFSLYDSPNFDSLIYLQEADARSAWQNEDGSRHGKVLKAFYKEDRRVLMQKKAADAMQKLLYKSATDQLKDMGVTPGPYFGKVRQALRSLTPRKSPWSAQAAKDWAIKFYSENPPE